MMMIILIILMIIIIIIITITSIADKNPALLHLGLMEEFGGYWSRLDSAFRTLRRISQTNSLGVKTVHLATVR